MRRLLILVLVLSVTYIQHAAAAEDNLLAVDVIDKNTEASVAAAVPLSTDQAVSMLSEPVSEEPAEADDSGKELKKIRAFHELFDSRQKELELIRLELEKSSLLLKKKEAEKQIHEIEKALPQARKEEPSFGDTLTSDTKEPSIDSSDMRIEFLLISDDLKEGQISMNGSRYSFKEGDSVASNLAVESIDPLGVTFRQPDGNILKLNFIN